MNPGIRLREIQEQMQDLLEEAKNLVRTNCSKFTYERAKAYWLSAIENGLGKPFNGEATIEEVILELEEEGEEEEDD